MGSFLKILLTVILFFYAFEMIVKWIFKRKMKKLQQRMDDVMQQGSQESAKPNEDKTPHIDPNIGEYTDFEEVE
jgi:hypothetical protein